jgi:small-conductance mechanosensitive channel
MTAKTSTAKFSLFDIIVRRLGKRILIFVILILLNFFLPLADLSEKYHYVVDKTLDILMTLSFAGILIALVKVGQDYVYHRYDLSKSDNLKERKIRTQLQFLKKLIVTLIVIVTICVILLSFENLRKLGTGLLTGVGVGGIIIGFAAQRSIANLLAGFQIAFTQPLRIDDALIVEGEWGRVEEITLTYVVLNIWDQRRLILPINYFIEKPFQNWTRNSAELLGVVILYVDYTLPLQPLRDEFDRLLELTDLWDRRAKVVQVTDATEKTMQLRILASAASSGIAFDLRCYIRENLITFIQKNYPESLPKMRAEYRAKTVGTIRQAE